jgi:hypothetical protein
VAEKEFEMNTLRTTLVFLSFVLFCSACGGKPVQFGVQGPFPPFVSIQSNVQFTGDLPIEVSAYITYDGIEEATLMVDWGDGSGWEPAVPDEESNLFLHTYAIEGTYTIRVKAQAGSTQLTDSLEITIASP